MSEISIHARLLALETATALALARGYHIQNLSDAQVDQIHARLVEAARVNSFPGMDPAASDHLAAEVEQTLMALLKSAKLLRSFHSNFPD